MDGPLIAGRYQVERPCGEGGMGSVFAARDRTDGQKVALKLLKAGDVIHRDRLDREAAVLRGLSHPGIVRYVDHGHAVEGSFLVMEWIEGETLAARLVREPIGAADAVHLAVRVAEALAFAHSHGVIHRDVKPSNMILADGRTDDVRLIDFGVARRLEEAKRLTATGALVGTPGYMAPEQVRPHRGVDARADLFALGCVLYECLTGSRAFTGDDAPEVWMKIVLAEPRPLRILRSDLPARLDELVDRLMAKRPEDRPQTAAAVAKALGGFGSLAGTPPPSPSARDAGTADTVTGAPLGVPAVCLILAALALDDGLDIAADVPRLEAIAHAHGARFEVLADGSIACLLEGAGDPAQRAARCALELRAALRDALMAIVGDASANDMTSLIERGLGLLRGEAARGQDDTGSSVFVDEMIARELGENFRIRATLAGYRLG